MAAESRAVVREDHGIAWVRYVNMALGMAVSSLCVIYLADHEFVVERAHVIRDAVIAAALSYIWVIALLGVAIVAHEFGHALCGLRAGMVVYAVRLWPLLIARRHGGLRLERTRVRKPAFCALGITTPHVDYFRQMFWFALGGPLANLVVAALACAVEILSSAPHPLLRVFAAINALLGLSNLLPIGKNIASDGTRLYRVALRQRAAEQEPELVEHSHAVLTQATPPEPPPEALARWRASRVPRIRALALALLFQRAVAAGDATAIVTAYTEMIGGLRELGDASYALCAAVVTKCTHELAYVELVRGADPDGVEKRLAALGAIRRSAARAQQLRVEAALAWRRGDIERATRAHQRALDEASGEFFASVRHAEIARLDELGALLFAAPAARAA